MGDVLEHVVWFVCRNEHGETDMNRKDIMVQRSGLYLKIHAAHQVFDALFSQRQWCPPERMDEARAKIQAAYSDLKNFDREHGLKSGGAWIEPGPLTDWHSA